MVSEQSYERRHQITKMRAAVFLLIFREQVRGPQSRSTEFAVSYDPDSEQVGESKPQTLTGKTDSGMGTYNNHLSERSTVTDMPNNTAAYENQAGRPVAGPSPRMPSSNPSHSQQTI